MSGQVPNPVALRTESPSTALRSGYEVWSGEKSVAPSENRKPGCPGQTEQTAQ
jgi:hypothetical protein